MRRRRRLFDDAPLAGMLTPQTREILALSVRDLEQVEERVEMGLGVFIDRPLGYDKQIGEPDLTPMLAHESFSPSVARRRWQELKKLCREFGIAVDEQKLDELFAKGEWPAGLPHVELAECPRPVAALTDVRKVADDFVIVRTLPGGLKALLDLYDWRPLLERCRLQFLADGGVRCCVRVLDETNGSVLALYDRQLRKSLELKVDASEGFARRAGVEWPRAGLRVVRVWEDGRDGELTPRQVDTVLRHAESPIRDL
jgi:hypothetical protein